MRGHAGRDEFARIDCYFGMNATLLEIGNAVSGKTKSVRQGEGAIHALGKHDGGKLMPGSLVRFRGSVVASLHFCRAIGILFVVLNGLFSTVLGEGQKPSEEITRLLQRPGSRSEAWEHAR